MTDVHYTRPCRTRRVRDDFQDHVRRGSKLPGLDYACATGSRVFASGRGTVVTVDRNPKQASGRYVTIQHPDGRRTYYLHLLTIKVNVGDRVKGGQRIALSGNSGTTTTGPHLHFTIKDKRGKCVDPAPILRRDAAATTTAAPINVQQVTCPSPAAPEASPDK
jgi:murein DD-endopeptidase MepM/ murein hydrolase activator NlpD